MTQELETFRGLVMTPV